VFDKVDASAADVRKLAAALNTYRAEVLAAGKKMHSALGAAQWNDARKTQFEARYRDLQKRIDGFLSGEVDQMTRALSELARRLDDVHNVRM